MKLIFMGSAAFAVPSLEALVNSPHEIIEVVTQPDKPAGRGMQVKPSPVATAAKDSGLKISKPKSVKTVDAIEHFRALKPELIVVVAYGKILPGELLNIPALGCVNVHASLLPKYRGAAPINWAIINGETETGVTTQHIAEELDSGDVLLSRRTPIGKEETAGELATRLAPMGAGLLIETIDGLIKRTIKPVPQDASKVTFAPILKKGDGRIDWSKPAGSIFNMVRGLEPWPGTFTQLSGKLLRIHKAAVADTDSIGRPGEVVQNKDHLAVACGLGTLYLLEVQIEGKRKMSAADFLRGNKIPEGTILG